ncbi:cyclic AMP-dependent transcription factor ATF-3-like [Paramuricea clavata]|uniref:Cyclic AMP-dependent transcription factor ATF-3-like n=1 Tax=Paramuricea clavata TaxID=317549 RepID=A0A6S7GXI1_PARCT|nr:cyclic AMP-dependent transcription factor ATF-3-like [Paramuricea clavata]
MPGLEAAFEPPTSTIPTFIYHDVEHERVSSHGVIGHEVLNEDDSPVRLEIRQSIEPTMNQEYMYDFGNGNNKTKPVEYEDVEKRRVRRERNKLAASKCRKKRKDHVRNLVESYEELEECNKNLETEIEKLHSEIRELEKMLDTHPCTRLLYTETGNNIVLQ